MSLFIWRCISFDFKVKSFWFWLCLDIVPSCSLCFRLSSGSGSRSVHPHSFSHSRSITDLQTFLHTLSLHILLQYLEIKMSFTSLVMISETGRDTSQQKNLHFVIFRAETDQSCSQNCTLTLLRDLQSLIRLPPCVCLMKCIQSRDVLMFSHTGWWFLDQLFSQPASKVHR